MIKIDVEKLNKSELEELISKLGVDVRKICDEACLDANELLKDYGVKVLMQFTLKPDKNETES